MVSHQVAKTFALIAGTLATLHAAQPGQIVRFGLIAPEVLVAPDIKDALDVAVVDYGHSFGAVLRPDGTVTGYGSASGPLSVAPPASVRDVVKIDGGHPIVIALLRDGTVATWPDDTVNGSGFRPPLGLSGVVDVGAGYRRCFAVKSDGTVVGWGEAGEVPARLTEVQAISIGKGGYNLALKRDGTVVDWVSPGWSSAVAANLVPAGLRDVVAISAGYAHGLALKRDGTVVGWGTGDAARIPAGLGNVVQVLGVAEYSYALRKDGSVVAWGQGYFGVRPVLPEGFVAARRLSAGRDHVFAIVGPRYLDSAQTITLAAGYDVSFGAAADGVPPGATVQWRRNGTAIIGATNTVLTLNAVQSDSSGSYDAVIAQGSTSRTTAAAALAVTSGNGSTCYLANVSTRGTIAPGAPLIVGFALAPGGSARELYLRGVGPGLASFAIAGFAPDPSLQVFQGNRLIEGNDNWIARSPPGDILPYEDYNAVGGFPLGRDSKDAALRASFLPESYTAVVAPADGRSGVTIVECYDYSFARESASMLYGGRITGRVSNLSTRGEIGAGQNALVAGFVLTGPGPQRLLVRGIGPSLGLFGVSGAVQTPRLRLYRGELILLENTAWEQGSNGPIVATVSAQVGAFALPPGSSDTALVVDLQPGNYTVEIATTGLNGVGLVEIYEVDR